MKSLFYIEKGEMRKLTASNNVPATLHKLKNGTWYILHQKKRLKLGLNRIKDLTERQRQADILLSQINADFEQTTFYKFAVKFIASRQNIVAEKTNQSLQTRLNMLCDYAKEKLNKKCIDFADFDTNFVNAFQSWCYDAPRQHSRNYAAKTFSIIRQFLNEAKEQGYEVNNIFETKKYKIKTLETDDIALSFAEIERLAALNLDGTEKDIRDLFLIACFSGLRFSDFSRLKTENFKEILRGGQKTVILELYGTQKTSDKVIVPLHNIAAQILIERQYILPVCPTNQHINRTLKEICEAAGITDTVHLRNSKAGKAITQTFKKYECVSTHTARRTFATLAYIYFKMPVSLIMRVTGHKTEAQFFRYVKIDKENSALDMLNYF